MRKIVVLPKAIKAIREAKAEGDEKFRGSRFSLACGITPGHLCNIEAGRKKPTEELTLRIAAQLGVDADAVSYSVEIPNEEVA